MYWYLCAPSLTGSLSLGPSPWRWEPVPWIQSLGNRQHQHQQQEQQCPVRASVTVEQQREREERERLSPPSSSSCMQVCSLTTEYYILHLSCLGSEASQHSTVKMLTEIWTGMKRTLVRIYKVRLKIAFNIDKSTQHDIFKITRSILSVQNPNIYSVYYLTPKNVRRQHILTLGRLETLFNN